MKSRLCDVYARQRRGSWARRHQQGFGVCYRALRNGVNGCVTMCRLDELARLSVAMAVLGWRFCLRFDRPYNAPLNRRRARQGR
jgi:hypothetical protein